jgi:hypothetical protein
MADEMKDQWPADVNEGYRLVSHRILGSLTHGPSDTGTTTPSQNQP